MTTASATALQDGLDLAAWSNTDLWRAALGVGGAFSAGVVADLTSGARSPTGIEHDILAATLNDHFLDVGRDHPVPYWTQLNAV